MSTPLRLLAASTLAVALVFTTATPVIHATAAGKQDSSAAAPAKKHTPQQQRMADCSHQAKLDGKKGAERKSFMSSCLKGKQTAATVDKAPQPKSRTKTGATNPK